MFLEPAFHFNHVVPIKLLVMLYSVFLSPAYSFPSLLLDLAQNPEADYLGTVFCYSANSQDFHFLLAQPC